ncbi:unnamed protein product [Closterium sp. NIES-54]
MKLLGRRGLTRALLLLGSPLHSSASASSTSAAAASASSTPPATATAASTSTAATEAPTSTTAPTPTPSSASTATTAAPTTSSSSLAPLALADAAPLTRSRRSADRLGANKVDSSNRSGSQDSGILAPRRAQTNQGLLIKEVLKNFSVEKFNGEGYDDWAWKMQLYVRQIGLLKQMIGEEPRPSDSTLQEDWDERASAGYYLMSQSLELNQRHHVMHLLPEVDCGPKAWTVLKELHAPTFIVATLMLERELSALRLSEGEPVQPVLDKMRDLYAKVETMAAAAMGCKGADVAEDVASVVLDAVQRRTTTPTTNKEVPVGVAVRNLDVGASRGQQEDASAKVGAELHPLDYWVLDTGAARTMTLRKDVLDDVRAAPIHEVCSASGHALKVAGAVPAAFKEADGKPVVLHDVLLVPDLKANLISLRKLAKAGVSTSTDGARTYKGQLGNRVLWDLHESKDVYRSMWQLPALAWHGGRQAGEGSASQGECNAVGGVGVKGAARKIWAGKLDVAHAARHATVARNRVLTKDGDDSWVPLERWLGRKPLVDMLRVFSVMEVAHVPKTGASAIRCVHLGLAVESKGWLLWEPSKGVLFESRDLKFVEGMMYGSWEKQPDARVSQRMEQITMQLDLTPSVWEEAKEGAAEGGDRKKVQEAPAVRENDETSTSGAAGSEGGKKQQGKTKKVKGVVMKGWETPVSRPGRTRMATKKLTAGADVAEQQLGTKEALLILPHGYDPDEEDEPAYCFLAPAPEESASMEEAKAGPDREKWLVSRDAEYQSLLENWDMGSGGTA